MTTGNSVDVPSEVISECLSGNKTVKLTLGWKETHVIYTRLNDTSDSMSDDILISNVSNQHRGHDVVHECRLQVKSAVKDAYIHVALVDQICTDDNKVFILGKFENRQGKMSLSINSINSIPRHIGTISVPQ